MLREAAERFYGSRLVSLVVFGSVGRGTATPESDVDVLVIALNLPRGRLRRVEEFREVEKVLLAHPDPSVAELGDRISVVIKSPEEAEAGSPLFLDMTEDAYFLVDREDFFRRRLERLGKRLQELGAKRIRQGDRWYWDLKPDYQPGEIFEL